MTLLLDSTDITLLQINFPILNIEWGISSNLSQSSYFIWTEQLKIDWISENIRWCMVGLSKFLLPAHNTTEGISIDKD